MSKVRYVARMFSTKSAERLKGLELLDVWEELSSHRMRSSGGPEGAGAIEIAGLVVGVAGCRRVCVGNRGVRG